MKRSILCLSVFVSAAVFAKLPPLSDEAKAKADEAKAKGAWSDKVAAFQLCKSQDAVAARYRKTAKDAGKVVETPKCEDPGPFVYTPPTPVSDATPVVASPAKK
ncbi:MAG TPA: hypothetical protein VL550_07475 [Rhodocyclaceae bacterium]|nr:hypothetical protein [Rhodocyclaceae bacterium]